MRATQFGTHAAMGLVTMAVLIAEQPTTQIRAHRSPDARAQLLAGLRSRFPERRRQAIEAALAARAFAAGFARGADLQHTRLRHVVDVHHDHWLRGCEAGRSAADRAAADYLGDDLLASEHGLGGTGD